MTTWVHIKKEFIPQKMGGKEDEEHVEEWQIQTKVIIKINTIVHIRDLERLKQTTHFFHLGMTRQREDKTYFPPDAWARRVSIG